jgi:hypothetical protein
VYGQIIMSDNNPIAKLGDLTKPATVLIKKISAAVGGIFKPYQIVRIAKAEAEACRIQAEVQIEVTDLQRRALHRFLEEEAKKQSNIESITQDALSLLEDKSDPEAVSDDWITNFFDKSRIVSDNEMQGLWSRILAGEANAPGTFAKRTVNLLADLDKEDAILFMRLCGFGWMIGEIVPLIFEKRASIYNDQGIDFSSLSHLESLGLIQFNFMSGYQSLQNNTSVCVHYYGKPLTLVFPKETENELHLGHVLLTRAGQQLAPVCAPKPVEGFFEYVRSHWIDKSLIPKSEAEQGVATDPPLAGC